LQKKKKIKEGNLVVVSILGGNFWNWCARFMLPKLNQGGDPSNRNVYSVLFTGRKIPIHQEGIFVSLC
jgi:hypothetical protein